MQVRYKCGKFTRPVTVTPGDTFNCSLNEEMPDGSIKTQTVTEEITTPMIITHWVHFYVPGSPCIGGIFGDEDTIKNIDKIFMDPVEVLAGEELMK